MPSSIIHLCVAKEVAKQIKVNKEEFLYGNILPDQAIVKNYKEKNKLHFFKKVTIGNITKENVDLEEFLSIHLKDLEDSVSLGIYSHFITDYLWIENFIINHLINIDGKIYLKTKRGNLRNNRITVYIDYDKMNEWLIEKYDISCEFIKTVKYNGSFKEIYNLPKEEIYEKINGYIQNTKKGEMDIFSKEEVEEFIKRTATEVVKKIKDLEIKEV